MHNAILKNGVCYKHIYIFKRSYVRSVTILKYIGRWDSLISILNRNLWFNNLIFILGSDVVVIPAGVPRKPGMTRDDLFNVNAGIIKDISNSIAKNCPKALVAIITNPVNTCVPIAAEILKKVSSIK